MRNQVKLTTRGRFAVMAMVELAKGCNDNKPLPLSEIAIQKDVSLSYLEQLIAGLRKGGLVKSYRGPGGGYVLARPAREIPVSDILQAAENSIPGMRKSNPDKAGRSCSHTERLWEHAETVLYSELRKMSLADVLE